MKTENRLIAKFMGYEFIDGVFKVPHTDKTSNSDFKEWCPTYWDNDLDGGGYLVVPCNLMFHSDWNWLMEVVERINDLNNVVQIHENWVRVVNNLRGEIIVDTVNGSMKEATYRAVIEFIEWHNEQE